MRIDIVLDGDADYILDEDVISLMRKAAEMALTRGQDGIPARGIYEISLSFVSPDEIKKLNAAYRSKDAVTDVLSFPMNSATGQNGGQNGDGSSCLPADMPDMLGDVVICMERARLQAQEYGHGINRELVYLFTHSVLHLMGMDHESDAERSAMRAEEELIMREVGLLRCVN